MLQKSPYLLPSTGMSFCAISVLLADLHLPADCTSLLQAAAFADKLDQDS
jgi:hypothetical protein